MHDHTRNVALLWTGGKDSALALLETKRRGYDVCCLATFAPPKPNFIAHPIAFIKLQARALGCPHYILPVSASAETSYEAGLYWLRSQLGIDCVVTGDIAEIGGHSNWIRERSRAVGINVHTPLWGRRRDILLQQLVAEKFEIYISFVRMPWLSKNWAGRELDSRAISELTTMSISNGMDLCGENGEYHTLVTGGPQFSGRIAICSYTVRATAFAAYMEIRQLRLGDTTAQCQPVRLMTRS